MTLDVLLGTLLIFALRVLGVALSTIRVLLMTRGMKQASAVLGFFEVLVYAVAIGKVVQDLTNLPYLLSYCLGFSVGTLVGMWLEERMAIGYATIRVISPGRGHTVVEAIRRAGHGATEDREMGKDGAVNTVTVVVRRRDVDDVCEIVRDVSPNAFVTIEETRAVQHGYLRATRHAR
jgi:uncharacterized protein YebE (UPF0316 family)